MDGKDFFRPSVIKIGITAVLFFIFQYLPIVPCQKYPVIPNPPVTWGVCNLNPLSYKLLAGAGHMYFGIANLDGVMLILSLVVAYLVAAIVVMVFSKK